VAQSTKTSNFCIIDRPDKGEAAFQQGALNRLVAVSAESKTAWHKIREVLRAGNCLADVIYEHRRGQPYRDQVSPA
jgi:hypothetical protein